MVPNGDSYEVYEKTAYEANGGGLLFRILAFEDTHYRDLNGCTILGFCGNKIFILIRTTTSSMPATAKNIHNAKKS